MIIQLNWWCVIIKRSRNGDGMILLSVTPLINNKNNMVGGRFNLYDGWDRISIEEMGSRMCEGQWLAPALAGALVILLFILTDDTALCLHPHQLTDILFLTESKQAVADGGIYF